MPETFGGMANWNSHVNALITDAWWDSKGNQYHMPEISDDDMKVIEELFAASVFRMLLEENMIKSVIIYIHLLFIMLLILFIDCDEQEMPLVISED